MSESIFLRTNHLFLRNPRGGVEDVANMGAHGFGAIFCNVGDYHPQEWETVRARAVSAGVVCGPWLRTADENHAFDPERLGYLLDVADEWLAPLIVNSEVELLDSGDEITTFIAGEVGDRDAAISVQCWPFDNVVWYPLARYPFLPQIFPAEAEAAERPEDCRWQWHQYGIKCVVDTFGTYDGPRGNPEPGWYDRLSPYGLYTADDCGNVFAPWAPLGSREPCQDAPPTNGGDMEKIGSQHGITGFANWLRAQPDVPPRGPKYDPDDVDTWPWPDKIERTLSILARDHDQEAG